MFIIIYPVASNQVINEIEVSSNRKIEICTKNPDELRSDYLYKLLPNILNPGGKQYEHSYFTQHYTLLFSCRKKKLL